MAGTEEQQIKNLNDFYGQQTVDISDSLRSIAGGYTNSVSGLANQGLVLKIASATGLQSPITFVAFMESLNDTFSQNFNQDKVFGRMDPIQSYQNTERKLSMSWKLLAANEDEASRNMFNISRLTKLMYPSYSNSGGQNKISSAPVMAIKYMNLVRDVNANGEYLFGTISSLSITPDLEFGVLNKEEASFNPDDPVIYSPGEILPKIFTLSINFSPIHHGTLGKNKMLDFHLYGGTGIPADLDKTETGVPVQRAIPPDSKYQAYVDSQLEAVMSQQDDAFTRATQPWTRVSDKWKGLFKKEKEENKK